MSNKRKYTQRPSPEHFFYIANKTFLSFHWFSGIHFPVRRALSEYERALLIRTRVFLSCFVLFGPPFFQARCEKVRLYRCKRSHDPGPIRGEKVKYLQKNANKHFVSSLPSASVVIKLVVGCRAFIIMSANTRISTVRFGELLFIICWDSVFL